MKDFLDKVKDFCKKTFNKDTWDKLKIFFVENQRYCYGAILLLVVIIVLANCAGPRWGKSGSVDGTESYASLLESFEIDKDYELNEYEDLNALIKNYLDAYVSSDIESLREYATPVTDNEASYITTVSNYMESIENLACYTMHGLTEGSFLVSAYYEIKFVDVETLSPTLDFFYVETDTEGNYFINNVYSNYNYSHQETQLNTEIATVIQLFLGNDAVNELRSSVKTAYNDALAADSNLYTLVMTTLPAEIYTWAESTITPVDPPVEDTQTVEPEPEPEPEPQPEPEPVVITVKVTAQKVNVRSTASESGDKLGQAYRDNTYTKLADEGDWTQIDFNGTTGYIKSQYLEVVQ